MRLFAGFVLIYGIMSAYSVASQIKQQFTLTPNDLQAFEWVKNNTTMNDTFALVTGQVPLRDSASEWFPALTDRKSVATVFGQEWVNDGLFGKHIKDYRTLQLCEKQGAGCLDTWSKESGQDFSLVLIRAQQGDSIQSVPLAMRLTDATGYNLVYSSSSIDIFRRK